MHPNAPHFHFANLTTKLYLLFLAIHLSFIGLFYIQDVWQLVVFNVFSAFLYVGCLALNRYQFFNTAFLLTSAEVVVHAALCSHFLGNAGFSEAALFLPMLFFIHPASTPRKFVYFACILSAYLVLTYNDQTQSPQYILGVSTMQFLNLSTSLLIITIGSYIAYYTYSTIRTKEEALETENQKLQEQYKIVEQLSVTDKLTGLYNRNKLDATFEAEVARADRTGKPLAMIILDVDHFKMVNDTYGHHVGDITLQTVAERLKNTVRQTDIIGRWGGEEFVVICPDTPTKGAKELAEKLRKVIEAQPFPEIGHKTASFGVSTHQAEQTVDALIIAADTALYQAKESGHNKVVVAK